MCCEGHFHPPAPAPLEILSRRRTLYSRFLQVDFGKAVSARSLPLATPSKPLPSSHHLSKVAAFPLLNRVVSKKKEERMHKKWSQKILRGPQLLERTRASESQRAPNPLEFLTTATRICVLNSLPLSPFLLGTIQLTRAGELGWVQIVVGLFEVFPKHL